MSKILHLAALLLLLPVYSWAACSTPCTKEGTTYTCTDISYDCVNDAVGLASRGDTISLSAGEVTWTSRIQDIAKDLIIQGAGIASTKITVDFTNVGYSYYGAFEFSPDDTSIARIDQLTDTANIEVSGIWFIFSDQKYNTAIKITNPSTTTPIVRVKIHDNKFTDTIGTYNYNRFAIKTQGMISGAVYKNIYTDITSDYTEGGSQYSFLVDRAQPGDGKGLYFEDNTMSYTGLNNYALNGANNSGGVAIFRYNDVSGSMSGGGNYMDIHGNQGTGTYAGQHIEIYGNDMPMTTVWYTALRGGKLVQLFNKVTAGVYVREEASDTATSTVLSGGGALNSCPENRGVARQTCAYNTTTGVDSCICQKAHSSYFVNNRNASDTLFPTIMLDSELACPDGGLNPYDCYNQGTQTVNNPREITENIEYYNHDASFDGSAGVGCGTLANRPANCTAGVGYFATTLACGSVPSASIGVNPTTPISGTLYKCTVTGTPGTWVAWWTPFTYPHPLRGVASTSPIGGITGVGVVIK
jgi:hypothetical protein